MKSRAPIPNAICEAVTRASVAGPPNGGSESPERGMAKAYRQQYGLGMSKAAVAARKASRKAQERAASLERWFAMAEYSSRIDSAVVTCDGCGLLQVTHQGLGCFMCDHDVGTSA